MELVRENVPFGDSSALWAGTRYWDRVVALGLMGATVDLALPQRLGAHAA